MKGVLLFAFNSPTTDYYTMAVATAKRVNHFLDLPVAIVTNKESINIDSKYIFDKVIIDVPDESNKKSKNIWINKGRYKAYEFTPYTETILLDTDYLVNSNQLLKTFDIYNDIMFPNKVSYLLDKPIQENISITSYDTCWATVITFNKSSKAKQLFECMGMIQGNYQHYINLFNIPTSIYRNDYSLTFAHRIINGQFEDKTSYMPWSLTHLASNRKVYKISDSEFCNEFIVMDDKPRPNYIKIKDMDFHILDKRMFMDIV